MGLYKTVRNMLIIGGAFVAGSVYQYRHDQPVIERLETQVEQRQHYQTPSQMSAHENSLDAVVQAYRR